MPEDHLERKTYRKSPGRQYGYEYDPLQSHSGKSQNGSTASTSGVLLSQRPDPRRTRQLLRQGIIASRRPDDEPLEEAQLESSEPTMAVDRSKPTRRIHHPPSQDLRPATKYIARTRFTPMHDEDEPPSLRYGANSGRVATSAEPYPGSVRGTIPTELMHEDEVVQEAWPHHERGRYVDPDLGIDEDEDLEQETYDYAVTPQTRGDHADRLSRAANQLRPRHATTRRLPEELLEEDLPEHDPDEDYTYDEGEGEQLPPGLHVVKKQSSSRRKFLLGAGAVVAGGVGVGLIVAQANPQAPLPQAINNVDKQVKDAFNNGLSQGAEQAKREMLTSLDTIENFTLQGAVDAARLTRTAYDVFVSPIIKFGSAITGDFLSGMLNAFKVARGWLAPINQDNATLAAIQKVLETWVAQVQNLPKQLDAITQTDLDGAQAYLHALQQKITDEMNALNNRTPTPPSPTPQK
jgi:hypothetical protein